MSAAYDPIAAVEAVEHYDRTAKVLKSYQHCARCKKPLPDAMPGAVNYCSIECAD